MGRKLADVLERSGVPINPQVGGKAPNHIVDREV